MHFDALIIGQGMAGTLLSHELLRNGKSVLVLDHKNKNNTSLVASAVLNPLVGKHWTIAKDAAALIPSAVATYQQLNQLLNIDVLQQKSILVFHPNEGAARDFEKQINTGNPYTQIAKNSAAHNWHTDWSIGEVSPVYTIDAAILLTQWRNYLQTKQSFCAEIFDMEQLQWTQHKIQYKEYTADKIVFCEGANGRQNPFFPNLPFTQNRGDALLLSIPSLSDKHIYHKDFRLVPHRDGLFWCGSNYTWQYINLKPDVNWRKDTESALKNWLDLAFETVDHWVAERPTTEGQKLLLLQHKEHKNMYFFNGMGTRGFSAGPTWAKAMNDLLYPI
jgi:glycine/D-amino acid oxidase-like deaminating enzyme